MNKTLLRRIERLEAELKLRDETTITVRIGQPSIFGPGVTVRVTP